MARSRLRTRLSIAISATPPAAQTSVTQSWFIAALKSQTFQLVFDRVFLGAVMIGIGVWFNHRAEEEKRTHEKSSAIEQEKRDRERDEMMKKLDARLSTITTVDTERRHLLGERLSEFLLPIHHRLTQDDAAWERIWRHKHSPGQSKIGRAAEERFILPNHEGIMNIINEKGFLMSDDEDLLNAISLYVRHVAIYRGLRASGDWTTDPAELGEPYPQEFHKAIKARIDEYRKQYDALVEAQTGIKASPKLTNLYAVIDCVSFDSKGAIYFVKTTQFGLRKTRSRNQFASLVESGRLIYVDGDANRIGPVVVNSLGKLRTDRDANAETDDLSAAKRCAKSDPQPN
jgi:hypothetical protein